MKRNEYPLSRRDNLVVQEMDNEILIYDLKENRAFCLNETSALIWQLCDGSKSAAEISQQVSRKLKESATEDLVWLALDQLKKEQLIDNSVELDNYFAGMSRREVIKKVGLGTMVALPVIASLAAPMAVEAQTCIGGVGSVALAGACTQNCQCTTSCCNVNAAFMVTMVCLPTGLANMMGCLEDCQCASGNCVTIAGIGLCMA